MLLQSPELKYLPNANVNIYIHATYTLTYIQCTDAYIGRQSAQIALTSSSPSCPPSSLLRSTGTGVPPQGSLSPPPGCSQTAASLARPSGSTDNKDITAVLHVQFKSQWTKYRTLRNFRCENILCVKFLADLIFMGQAMCLFIVTLITICKQIFACLIFMSKASHEN